MVLFTGFIYIYINLLIFWKKKNYFLFFNKIWLIILIFSILILTLLKKECFYIEDLEINFNYYNLYLLINFYNHNVLNIFNLFLIYLIITRSYKCNSNLVYNILIILFISYFVRDLSYVDLSYKSLKNNFTVLNTQLFNNLIFFHPLITHSLYSFIVITLIHVSVNKFKLIYYKKKKKFFSFFFYNIKILFIINLFLSLFIIFLGSNWAIQELVWNSWWNWDIIEIMNFIFLLMFFGFIHFLKINFFLNSLFYIKFNLIYYTIFLFMLLRYDVTGSLHSFNIFEEIEIFIFFFIFVILIWIYSYISLKLKFLKFQFYTKKIVNIFSVYFSFFFFLINFYFMLFFCIMLWDINFTDDFIFIYSFCLKFFFFILFLVLFFKKSNFFILYWIYSFFLNYIFIIYFFFLNFYLDKNLKKKIYIIHLLIIFIAFIILNEWSFQIIKLIDLNKLKITNIFLFFKKTFIKTVNVNLVLLNNNTENYFYKITDNNYIFYNFINFFKTIHFNEYLSEQISNIFIKTTNFSSNSYNFYWNECFFILYDYNYLILILLGSLLLYLNFCII